MAMSEEDQDAHIKAIYYVMLPFVVLTIVALFVSILAWNSTSDFTADHNVNSIAWSLSVIQIVLALFALLLGVAAVFGFWAIRGAAVAAAKREARIYLDEKAAQTFGEAEKTRQNSEKVDKANIPDYVDEEEILAQAQEEESDNGDDGGSKASKSE